MKFECQTSCGGKCCKPQWDGKSGFVFLTAKDIVKLASFLNKPISTFADYFEFDFTRFTKQRSFQWILKLHKGHCRFLKDGKCEVYEARPTQCRTFPFWPELMVQGTYEELKNYCPGVGVGEEHTHALLAEQIKADEELCNQAK